MVKIRLMRIGTKKRPFYRVVAVDERKKRTGQYIELLGTYNPLTEPKEIILKKDRIEYWQKNGAVLSDGFLRITKQAPQKPPRKPKKEKEEKTSVVSNQSSEKKDENQEISESVVQTEAKTAEVADSTDTPTVETAGGAEREISGVDRSEVVTSEDAPETPERQDPQAETAEESQSK